MRGGNGSNELICTHPAEEPHGVTVGKVHRSHVMFVVRPLGVGGIICRVDRSAQRLGEGMEERQGTYH